MTTQTLSINPDSKIEIEHVGGDLTVQGWDRPDVETRADDAQHAEQEGGVVTVSTAGDLNLFMPRRNALTLTFVGGDVKLEQLDGAVEILFVGGDALLQNLTGNVSMEGVVGGDFQMDGVNTFRLNASRRDVGGDLSAKIQRKVEAATRRAEKKIREAEHKMRRAEFISIEHKARRGNPPIPPVPPIPPREPKARHWNFGFDASGALEAKQPVSDEERMTILKMLQEKKITSEQAEKLLAALEEGL